MLAERVRQQWTPEQLAQIYSAPFDQSALGYGADIRVSATKVIGKLLYELTSERPRNVVDLSCGNGDIPNDIAAQFGVPAILGDFAAKYAHVGPIEDTLDQVDDIDLFVCAETIEHLWDPETVLHRLRDKASRLVCSVPLWERAEQELNGEHYWAFDREGFEAMLSRTGWDPVLFAEVPSYPVGGAGGTYQCGVWGCE